MNTYIFTSKSPHRTYTFSLFFPIIPFVNFTFLFSIYFFRSKTTVQSKEGGPEGSEKHGQESEEELAHSLLVLDDEIEEGRDIDLKDITTSTSTSGNTGKGGKNVKNNGPYQIVDNCR